MKCTIRTFLESRVGVLEHSQLFPGFDSLTRVSQSTQKIAKNAPEAAQLQAQRWFFPAQAPERLQNLSC